MKNAVAKSLLILALALLSSLLAAAQDLPEFEDGLKPFGTYHGGDIDNVSLTNGHLTLKALLWSYPQRGGKLDWDPYLIGNTKGWTRFTHCDRYGDCTTAVRQRGGGTVVSVKTLQSAGSGSSRSCQLWDPGTQKFLPLFLMTAGTADGSNHIMGLISGTVYETIDASGIRYDSSTGITTDRQGIHYLPVGQSYPFDLREDPNGNKISATGVGTSEDTLGRTTSPGTAATCPTGGGLLPVSSSSAVNFPGPASAGGTSTLTFCYATVTLSTNFFDADVQYNGTTSAIQSLVLPNATHWDFLYDSYGNIAKIIFPTGGSLSYTWATIEGATEQARAIVARTLDATDGTGSHTWNYFWGIGIEPTSVVVTDPLGNDAVHTFTYFNGSPYVNQSKYYQGSHSGGTLLKTVSTDFATSPGVLNVDCGGGLSSVFNVRPIRVTTNMGGWVRKVETDYDSGFLFHSPDPNSSSTYYGSFGDVIARREYDWGSGAPGPLLRQTTTTYLATSPGPYQDNNLLDLQWQVTVKDGGGNTKAATSYAYDATTPLSSGISTQHDQNPPNGNYRGNLTSVGRWLDTAGYLTTNNVVYDTGMLQQTTDPGGHPTQYAYSTSFAGAYPTTVTDAMSHPTNYNYDFNTGLITSVTDVNGRQTAYTFDAMWRPQTITYPTGGGTATFGYTDGSSSSVTLTRSIASGINFVKTAYVDGVGRVKQSALTSDPDGTTYVDTTYDGDGRKASVSNPYRSISDPTYGITSFGYDGLGRVTSVTSPSGGSVTTSYAGIYTTVTDQQGKQRKSLTDGLGRLIAVWEPDPVSGNLFNETDYTYNTLDNLTQVQQKGNDGNSAHWRTRTFTYDSWSRLLTAFNPESGTTTYTYNALGNDHLLSSKQDARGMTITYASYDADHRLTSKTYSDSTPAVGYGFDAAACLGQSSCYNIHHRTSMTDAAGSEAWAYDAMGRTIADQRTTNSVTKTTGYVYNDDGSLKKLTYGGSGRGINYTVSGAGRATVVQQDVGQGGFYYVASSPQATYAPQGGLQSALFGAVGSFTGVTETIGYNNRLQPTSLYANSTGGTAINLTYNYADANGHNNGNVMGITNNLVPDGSRSFTFTYDQLNRIKTAATSAGTATYNIDIWGNLYSISLTGNTPWQNALNVSIDPATNRITGDAYDTAGNMTGDGLYGYTYNAENQQTLAAGVTYKYDGDGKRVQKVNGTLYWYDVGGNVLTETNSSGGLLKDYIYFGGKRIAYVYNSSAYFYWGDHLGNSRVVTNSIGGTCYNADFGPYGKEQTYTTTCSQNYKFTGKERDTETGNDYFGARFYENNLGRFMSVDPKAASGHTVDPQTWNRYAYARNNPLMFVDPDGRDYRLSYDPKTNTATITINILLTGPGGTKELAAAWQKNAREGIGGQHKTSFGLTIDIRVNVTTDPKALPAGGRNEMNVDPKAEKTEVTGGGNKGTGKPDEIADPTAQKHETLHYGSLTDQYDPETGKPLPGQEGTLMGDPRNPDSKFTQEEVDEMGRNACDENAACKEKNPTDKEEP